MKHSSKSFVLQTLQGRRLKPLDFEINTKMFKIGCIPFWFLKLKSKVLVFGQTRSNPQKRF